MSPTMRLIGGFTLATLLTWTSGAPLVTLPSGELGSIYALIEQQKASELASSEGFVLDVYQKKQQSLPAEDINVIGNRSALAVSRTAKSAALAKRGIGFWGTWGGVTDIQALTALKDLAWWYSWGAGYTSSAAGNLAAQLGIEFVPMLWNAGSSASSIPAGSKYLLGLNEPNVRPQANTAPYEAARYFPTFKNVATQRGLMKGTPSASPCPGADYSSDCVLRNQWDWWDQYYASCNALNIDCTPDFIATHMYSCSPTSLVSYIDALWRRFKKPIWITEFACCLAGSTLPSDQVLAQQITFMRTAMSIMDADPRVVRYAWFAPRVTSFACLGDSANLLHANASLTVLGQVYTNQVVNTNGLPAAVKAALTAQLPTVATVPWDELCFPCDASSSFWTMQALLKRANNVPVYRAFVARCRLCGYQDEWNKTPL